MRTEKAVNRIKADTKRVDYFKRDQGFGRYHYVKVIGGPGKTVGGYQEVLNFLNEKPIISIETNFDNDGCTGTWCNFEVGEKITEKEYQEAYQRATSGVFEIR